MRLTRPLAVAAVFALGALGACYNDPNQQLNEMQQTLDLGNTLDELNARTSDLQVTLDSLRGIVAKQDSAIVTLANLAGVRYVR